MAKNIFSGAKDASRAKITICTAFLCAALLPAVVAVFALSGCSAEPDDALLGGSGGSGTSGKIEITKGPVSPTEPYSVNAPAKPLTVEVIAEGVTPKYQWYASEPNSNPVLLTNATDPQYTPDTGKIGTFTYFVVVSAADDSLTPQRSAPAIVSVSDAELIINIFGGSIKDGAFLRNTTDNTTVNLTSINPGWATYHLADGAWTLENYTPEGGALTLSPSNGTVQITMGGRALISAMVTNSAAGRGKVIVSVNGVTLPANAKLESQGGEEKGVPPGGGTFEDLAPDIWWLNGLPNDGEFITDPPSAMVTVYAGATANIGVSAGNPDIDNDGYPSKWEREHRNEGFNSKIPNEPFGIDLSGVGAAPPGITFESNIYTAQNDGLERVYRVYKSDPATQDVNSIVIAAGAKAKLMLDTAGVTLSGGITVNNGAKLTLSSMGNVGDKPNVIVPDGATATVVLNGVSFTANSGSSPIDVAGGGKLTLLLDGTNSVTADNNASVHVPDGAEMIIDSAKSSGALSGTLTAGFWPSFTGLLNDAGIGSNKYEASGSITIKGGVIRAFTRGGAAIGSGGGGSAGNITIDGGNIITECYDHGTGIGSGGGGNGGAIIINGGTVTALGKLVSYSQEGPLTTGIGTGDVGKGGSVTINGGVVNAYGNRLGIGGYDVNVSIYGGEVRSTSIVVTANPGGEASINIYGGTVINTEGMYAMSSYYSGTAAASVNSYININGGTIIAKAIISSTVGENANSTLSINTGGANPPVVLAENIDIDESHGGVCAYKGPNVSAGTEGVLDGLTISPVIGFNPFSITGAITFASTGLTVPSGGVLKVPAGWTIDLGTNAITNDGTIYAKWNGGVINGGGRIIQGGNYGSITGQEVLAYKAIIDLSDPDPQPGNGYSVTNYYASYYDIYEGGSYKIIGSNASTQFTVYVTDPDGDVTLTLENVTMTEGKDVDPLIYLRDNGLSEKRTVTILLSGENTLIAQQYGCISPKSSYYDLVIDSAASENAGSISGSSHSTSGSLIARITISYRSAAAIGGFNTYGDGCIGAITILGGTISAEATYGAAIGLPAYENKGYPTHGGITIKGGIVNAKSDWGAGIGGGGNTFTSGNAVDGGSIAIEGGFVFAASSHGAAIGGGAMNDNSGNGGAGGNISISGGFVAAFIEEKSGAVSGSAIGGGAGGGRGGYGGDGGNVVITGGTVVAFVTYENCAYGIGPSVNNDDTSGLGSPADMSGSNLNTSMLFTSNLVVNNLPDQHPGLFYAYGGAGDPDAFNFTQPTWNEADCTFSGGTITLDKDLTVPSGASLIIPPGWTLNTAGHNLGNNGTIYYNPSGSISVTGQAVTGTEYGTIINSP